MRLATIDLLPGLRVTALHLALTLGALLTIAVPIAAQPVGLGCMPPQIPMTDLPKAVLADYRAEIAAEFEAYFGAVSDYVTCLDIERARILAEARAATVAYSTLLAIPPKAKDLP